MNHEMPGGLLQHFSRQLAQDLGRNIRVRERSHDHWDLLSWGRHYLPEHFRLPPSAMHQWLSERLGAFRSIRGAKVNVIGPRGSAKSTVGTLAYVLRAALELQEPYIWIVSETNHQACIHLENVKAELLDNQRLAEDFPGEVGVGPVWRRGAVMLPAGVLIEAFGAGQRIRGRRWRAQRPTLIVSDDVQDDRHIDSPTQRARTQRWFHGALLKAGTKRTNVLNLATALHRDAIAMELHRTPGWQSRLFRAIEQWPRNMDLWEMWEAIYCNLDDERRLVAAREFYEANRAAMHEGSQLLWPEEEDLYTLMTMRVDSGRTAFEREKQGSPIDPERCEWPEEYFDERIWFEAWPANLSLRTMALDPSKGGNDRRGDYSALVMLGIDLRGTIYVEADLARRGTPQMVADAVDRCARFRPPAFGVETNQFQDLIATELAAELARQQVVGIQPWTLDNRVNKQVRIRRLGPLLSAGRLKFKSGSASTRLLVDQLRDFPAGQHDDGPDALEMAVRLAAHLQHGRFADDGLGESLLVNR